MDHQALALHFLSTAYADYIAARFLLNNSLVPQGVTLASSAVEKYLKMVLAANGVVKKVHLTKLEVIKAALANSYYDFTIHFDKHFLEICSKAYQMRYYDDLKEPITIGFFVNQFVGELDFFVYYVEKKVIAKMPHDSEYVRDVNAKSLKLYQNNYILSGITKKEHMEKPGQGYGLYFDPSKPLHPILINGNVDKMEYDGRIWDIKVDFK